MTAHVPIRPPRRPAAHGADTRLPWWGVALPVTAFAVLLVLLVGGGEASAAAEPPQYPVRLLERVLQVLSH
ncbi:MAG TPA: hypothetical protein VFY14_10160 [Streptomyces sp.]|nr:hypothetical protein [Streptomyces sp.]